MKLFTPTHASLKPYHLPKPSHPNPDTWARIQSRDPGNQVIPPPFEGGNHGITTWCHHRIYPIGPSDHPIICGFIIDMPGAPTTYLRDILKNTPTHHFVYILDSAYRPIGPLTPNSRDHIYQSLRDEAHILFPPSDSDHIGRTLLSDLISYHTSRTLSSLFPSSSPSRSPPFPVPIPLQPIHLRPIRRTMVNPP